LKRLNPGLLVVLAAAAAVHFAVAALDFPTLARSFLYDDSFYDFQIARHIAHGEGPTFDGANLTNGFQPLYVAFLVPIYWVAGSSETIPIHAALALSALCTVLTTYLLYRILARRTSETAAIVAAGAWVFSSIVVRQTANGLETSVAVLMLASTPRSVASEGALTKVTGSSITEENSPRRAESRSTSTSSDASSPRT